MFAIAALTIVVFPLLAYVTIERPATSFPVRWALLVVLVGCAVIIGNGWLLRSRPEAHTGQVLVAALCLLGLAISYVAGNWWMAPMAAFTGLLALIISRGPGPKK